MNLQPQTVGRVSNYMQHVECVGEAQTSQCLCMCQDVQGYGKKAQCFCLRTIKWVYKIKLYHQDIVYIYDTSY